MDLLCLREIQIEKERDLGSSFKLYSSSGQQVIRPRHNKPIRHDNNGHNYIACGSGGCGSSPRLGARAIELAE